MGETQRKRKVEVALIATVQYKVNGTGKGSYYCEDPHKVIVQDSVNNFFPLPQYSSMQKKKKNRTRKKSIEEVNLKDGNGSQSSGYKLVHHCV